ncbi:hypothetical protein FAVG1_02682 [Fusarium avenaceum]|nr:hypothetical protein FAVG1_02682 [Fusarium avenaceum]
MPLPIIHINGFPGIGKLTIARKLVALLAPYNGKLVHNHLLIDPAGTILSRASADYQPLRRAIRTAIFNILATSRDTFDSVFVFTDFQSDDDIGSAVMAARRGCAFIPIVVTCSKEENLRRLTSMGRSQHEKLTDVELVARIRDNSAIHQSPDDFFRMELDVTELDEDTAAHVMHRHILKVLENALDS